MNKDWKGYSRETALECIGKGWAPLVAEFYDIVKINPKYEDVHVTQVKEKFGGLRIYFSGGDDVLLGFAMGLEHCSYLLCEECGERGKLNTCRGWHLTQCKQHWDGRVSYDFKSPDIRPII